MMNEVLNTYFKKAQSWADDNFHQVEQSRNRYKNAFLTAMGLNILSITTVIALSHYQTLVPLMVHHYDNGMTTVEPINPKEMVTNRAQIESDIARYIMHREAYDTSSYRAQFDLVTLLSNEVVKGEYLKEQAKDNQASPIKKLNTTQMREVHIYSINFLDSFLENEKDLQQNHHNLAEVVLSLTDIDKLTHKRVTTSYTALISWEYRKPSEEPAIRWKNWDGFEVTRYSKNPRAEL